MDKDAIEILKEISRKLGELIILSRLNARKAIEEARSQIEKDDVSSRILELTSSPLSYSDLSAKVAKEFNVSERTVKRKMSALRALGFLKTTRRGTEVYYENSGLLG